MTSHALRFLTGSTSPGQLCKCLNTVRKLHLISRLKLSDSSIPPQELILPFSARLPILPSALHAQMAFLSGSPSTQSNNPFQTFSLYSWGRLNIPSQGLFSSRWMFFWCVVSFDLFPVISHLLLCVAPTLAPELCSNAGCKTDTTSQLLGFCTSKGHSSLLATALLWELMLRQLSPVTSKSCSEPLLFKSLPTCKYNMLPLFPGGLSCILLHWETFYLIVNL